MTVPDDTAKEYAVELVRHLVDAMALQKAALLKSDWSSLQSAVNTLTDVLTRINAFPGGLNGIAETISEYEKTNSDQIRSLLKQGDKDRQASNTLIKMNLARFNAIGSFIAASQDRTTYQATLSVADDAPQHVSRRV
ncbi:MAG: hypothetical protein EBX30_09500 [Betaproteobacteria bacterium]|nr:hypothetical protein [Betaproteobacteria bacterium]